MLRVNQEHNSGCFVAAVAMLLGVSYAEAFNRLFPDRIMPTEYWEGKVGLLIEESIALLPKVGIQTTLAKIRSVRYLRKRTALIVLRWRTEPWLSHAVVFDGEERKFLDPVYENPLSHSTLNKNLEAIYYIKRNFT